MKYRVNSVAESFAIGLVLLIMSGCQSPPEDTTSTARAAIESARQAGAEEYATEEFQEAVSKLEAAQAELAKQEDEWFFSRDYSEAERLLEEARVSAEEVAGTALTRKEQARSDSEDLSAEAREAIESARSALERAPRGKGSRADVAALESDLRAAESSLAQAERDMRSEDYLAASEKFTSARDSANRIVEQIEQATGRRR